MNTKNRFAQISISTFSVLFLSASALAMTCPHAFLVLGISIPNLNDEFISLKKLFNQKEIKFSKARFDHHKMIGQVFSPLVQALKIEVAQQLVSPTLIQQNAELASKEIAVIANPFESLKKNIATPSDFSIRAYARWITHAEELKTNPDFDEIWEELNKTFSLEKIKGSENSLKEFKNLPFQKVAEILDHNFRNVKKSVFFDQGHHLITETLFAGRFQRYQMVDYGPHLKTIPSLSVALVPEGDYGAKFSRDLALTSKILIEIAVGKLTDLSGKISDANFEILSGTGRATESSHSTTYSKQEIPLRSLVEGIHSITQMVSFLSGQKIEGVDSGDELMRLLTQVSNSEVGLTTKLAMRLPMGLLGPSILRGVYPTNPLRIVNNKIELTPEFKSQLYQLGEFYGKPNPSEDSPFAMRSGLGCPLGYRSDGPTTALQTLMETYFEVYKIVSSRP